MKSEPKSTSLPPEMLAEGKKLFFENKVKDFLRSKDGRIMAFVKSSSKSGQTVIIASKGIDDPETKCLCSEFKKNRICGHIAATILYAEAHPATADNQEPPVNISEISTFLPAPDVVHEGFEIPLPKQDTIASVADEEGKAFRPRHKIVFLIDRSGDLLSIADSGWSVKAMMRPFKPDGSMGPCLKLDEKWLTEPLNGSELSGLDIFKRHFFSARSFAMTSPLLLSDPPAYMVLSDHNGNLTDIKPSQITSLSIRFRPSSEDPSERKFLPILDLKDYQGISLTWYKNCDAIEIATTPNSVLMLTSAGNLFYKLNDPFSATIVSRLTAKQHSGFTIQEICEISERITASQRKDILLSTRIKSRRITHPIPDPIIELDNTTPGTCKATLILIYQNQEFHLADKRIPETVETETEFILTERNKEYENKIAWVFTHLMDPAASKRTVAMDVVTLFRLTAMEVLVRYGDKLLEAGFKIRMKGSKAPISGTRTARLELTSGIDWIELKVKITDSTGKNVEARIDPELLRQKLVMFDDKLYFISKDDIALLEKLKNRIEADGKIRIPKSDIATLASLDGLTDGEKKEITRAKDILKKLTDSKKMTSAGKPEGFHGDLRDYQQVGLDWLLFLHENGLNGCLADDMGLGKTIQALALLSYLKEKKKAGLTLIVCPVTTIGNWEREMAKFTPDLKLIVHTGPGRTKKTSDIKKAGIVLLSYHILRNDIDLFKDLDVEMMILDEAHNIKNHVTDIYKAVRSVKAKHRLSLTGTPVENNIMELWSQMDFLNPGLLGSHTRFLSLFKTGVEGHQDPTLMERLRKTVAPFILRRKKENVLMDLPKKQEITLYSEMEPDQAEVYENHRKYFHEMIANKIDKDGVKSAGMAMINGLLRLRQIAIFPQLVDAKFSGVSSSKFDQFWDLVTEVMEEGHKVLVFSQFTEALKILRRHFDRSLTPYSYLDGMMNSDKRQEQIDNFQTHKKTDLFLLSLKAGGVGITLTAADYVILLDPWWNPAAEMQAVDRCCRIGQTKKVFAYKLITKGTVEEKVLELQEKKKQLVENLITTEKGIFRDLQKEEILGLFE